jgi:hypothetical protein
MMRACIQSSEAVVSYTSYIPTSPRNNFCEADLSPIRATSVWSCELPSFGRADQMASTAFLSGRSSLSSSRPADQRCKSGCRMHLCKKPFKMPHLKVAVLQAARSFANSTLQVSYCTSLVILPAEDLHQGAIRRFLPARKISPAPSAANGRPKR